MGFISFTILTNVMVNCKQEGCRAKQNNNLIN